MDSLRIPIFSDGRGLIERVEKNHRISETSFLFRTKAKMFINWMDQDSTDGITATIAIARGRKKKCCYDDGRVASGEKRPERLERKSTAPMKEVTS
jgi:hypothetical protein